LNGSASAGMSSLTLSILILAVLVALGVGAHSLWILNREKKKLGALSRRGTDSESGAAPPHASSAAAAALNASGLGDGTPTQGSSDASLASSFRGIKSESFSGATGASSLDEFQRGEEPHLGMDGLDEALPVLTPVAENTQTSSRALQGSLLDDEIQSLNHPFDETASDKTPAMTSEARASPLEGQNGLPPAMKASEEAIPSGARILHDEADCMVEIALQQASSGDRLIGLTKSIRRAGGKPVAFEGLCNDQWEGLRYGTSYKRLRAGILLSNRQGPLNAMEFSEFTSKLQGLGAQLGVPIDMPEMNAILQRARSLDSMLAECDVQLGLAVDCSRALSTSDLAGLAKRLGLHERGNNRYAMLSDTAEVIYSVALGEKAQRLQLMFDVPRVLPGHKPWWKMAEAAHQASVLFEGRITDDGGRDLSEQSFRNVAIALEGRQQALEEAGVPAGSALALRVFN
jgi:hypothetical protein